MPSQHAAETNLYCPLPEKPNTGKLTAEKMESSEPVSDSGSASGFAAPHLGTTPPPQTKREFTSTLIEFPKRTRTPEWRDAVRERVREVQERRRGEEGGAVVTETVKTEIEQVPETVPATVINLKPNLAERPANKLIARALERVERSRQAHQAAGTGVAEAVASVETENNFQAAPKSFTLLSAPTSAPQTKPAPRKIEAPVFEEDLGEKENVEFKIETEIKPIETPAAATPKKEPRKISMISEADADSFIESQMRVSVALPKPKRQSPRTINDDEQEIAPRVRENIEHEEASEDYAPLGGRLIAGLLDSVVCAGITAALFALFAPTGFFSAESFGLSNALTVLGVFVALKFLYLTASIALSETTLAGKFFSLRTVCAEDGTAPGLIQAAISSAVYLLTLALAGLGFLTILMNSEKRTLHDLLSGTVVIRES